jgi:hypothetical protein
MVLLLSVILDRRLDGVFGQYRAVDLHRGQAQLVDDIHVADLEGLVDGLAFHPLGGQRGTGDGAPAAEGLEPGVFNHAGLFVDLDLELHHIAALGRAHHAGADARVAAVQRSDVTRVGVMVQDFFRVSHG